MCSTEKVFSTVTIAMLLPKEATRTLIKKIPDLIYSNEN